MPKAGRRTFRILGAVGVALMAVGLIAFLRTSMFVRSAATADGSVIENVGRRNEHARVRFRTAAGEEVRFVSRVGSTPPLYRVGANVRVLYDPGDPAHAEIDGFVTLWLFCTIFGGLGATFSSVGLMPLAWERHVARRNDWLRVNGRRIFAELASVERNPYMNVGGQNPWRIVCKGWDPATNQDRFYRSRNLWSDPQPYIKDTRLEVFVDLDHPRRYFVETSFLPKEE